MEATRAHAPMSPDVAAARAVALVDGIRQVPVDVLLSRAQLEVRALVVDPARAGVILAAYVDVVYLVDGIPCERQVLDHDGAAAIGQAHGYGRRAAFLALVPVQAPLIVDVVTPDAGVGLGLRVVRDLLEHAPHGQARRFEGRDAAVRQVDRRVGRAEHPAAVLDDVLHHRAVREQLAVAPVDVRLGVPAGRDAPVEPVLVGHDGALGPATRYRARGVLSLHERAAEQGHVIGDVAEADIGAGVERQAGRPTLRIFGQERHRRDAVAGLVFP